MQIEVIVEKTDWNAPEYILKIDGEIKDFYNSRQLTNTKTHDWAGIFTTCIDAPVKFMRGDTQVIVDFGSAWDIAAYDNPALEIKRRIALVDYAFYVVKESYTKSWAVTL